MADPQENDLGVSPLDVEVTTDPPAVDLVFMLEGRKVRMHLSLETAKNLRRILGQAIRAMQPGSN